MRIALDVSVAAKPGGTATYIRHLLEAFGRVGGGHDFVLWCGSTAAADTVEPIAPARSRLVRATGLARTADTFGRVLPWNPVSLERLVGPVDVFHGLSYLLPSRRGRAKRVVSVHDLSALRHPEWQPVLRSLAHRLALRRTLRAVHHVITLTRAVRSEVIARLALPPEKVTAVHLGVSPDFVPRAAAEVKRVLDLHGLSAGGYLCWIGALEPRKNVERLIDAVAALRRYRGDVPPLVLAGPPGWRNRRIERRLAEPGVRHLGFLAKAEMHSVLAGAACFVYPSLYEGFGLPVLEALACGTPVVASRDPAIEEVAGDAALLVDPADASAIAAAIARVLDDGALREGLARRGPARAAEFRWERTAAETLAVYERVLTGGS